MFQSSPFSRPALALLMLVWAGATAAQPISPAPPVDAGAPSGRGIARSAPTAPAPNGGSDSAVTQAEMAHRSLAARNAALLKRGDRCAQAVKDGRLGASVGQQYRCILGGGSF